jgi:hypothetical protein
MVHFVVARTPFFVLEFFDQRGLIGSCGGILSIGSYVFSIAVLDSSFACSLAAVSLCCRTNISDIFTFFAHQFPKR